MARRVAREREDRFAQELFAPLPERYDALAEVLSMGQNGRWRRAAVAQIARSAPQRILDVASGTARVAVELARTMASVSISASVPTGLGSRCSTVSRASNGPSRRCKNVACASSNCRSRRNSEASAYTSRPRRQSPSSLSFSWRDHQRCR